MAVRDAGADTGLDLVEALRTMIRIREFEEMCRRLFARGRLPGFVHLYIGQEAVATGACLALRADDQITSNHRGHGHVIAKGGDPARMFAELLGKAAGYCRGKGGSMHIVDFPSGMLGTNGIVGGGIPIAAGAALANQYLGNSRVSLSFFGDGGANLAGLVCADELAATTGDNRYADLLVQTADRYRTTHDNGVPVPSNPNYQVEDMFFTAAVLGRAFKLTGDDAYLNILTRFLLDANVQQEDGLFWHDRRTPFYWGRGNGFAALSYAETLTYLPDDHPDRDAVLAIHRRHLQALRGYQHRSGMWRQVVNGPGSYPEMTVTCMVGYALARGLRRAWLDAGYTEMLTRAWQGVAARIDDHGGLVDVCTGTGVQQSTRDYLDRPAIFGPDERGGALSIWFVTEMESFLRQH